MSDRIGVMSAGRLEQVDVPATLYEAPATAFVAGFMGTSNLLAGTRVADGVRLRNGLTVPGPPPGGAPVTSPGDDVVISLRPENILLAHQLAGPGVALRGRVVEIIYLGSSIQYTVECHGMTLTVTEPNRPETAGRHGVGDEVNVSWSQRHTVVLPRHADARTSEAEGAMTLLRAPDYPPRTVTERVGPDDFQETTRA